MWPGHCSIGITRVDEHGCGLCSFTAGSHSLDKEESPSVMVFVSLTSHIYSFIFSIKKTDLSSDPLLINDL